METGFLNFHDEERFTVDNYEQSNGFESENSLFGGFISDYNGQFDALPMSWTNSENVFSEIETGGDRKDQKEDFHKTFLDWQQHLSDFETKETEDEKGSIFRVAVPTELPDIFDVQTLEDGEINDSFIEEKPISTIDLNQIQAIQQDPLNTCELRAIKTENESPELYVEDDCVDVETIEEETVPGIFQIPIEQMFLEAGDLTTLLEQFEASEAVNGSANPTILPAPVIDEPIRNESTAKVPLANKSIKDVLPQEVIDRIKESAKKRKMISLVPAARMPPSRSSTIRVQETENLPVRSKLIKIVGTSTGESVQLDHDYCSNSILNESNSFQTVEITNQNREESISPIGKEKWKNSKKDSGLESAENSSDASETPLLKTQVLVSTSNNIKPGESLLIRQQIKVERFDIPMVSLLKPLNEIKTEPKEEEFEEMGELEVKMVEVEQECSVKEEPVEIKDEKQEQQKKKKLNLEEYRKRRKNMDTYIRPSKPFQKIIPIETLVIEDTENQKEDRVMVNAEVQTQENSEPKKEETHEEKLRAMALEKWGRKIVVRSVSLSSTSSSGSRSHSSRRRGRSKRRFSRSRRQRSVWSGSHSRSRSNSRSNSSYSSSISSSSRSRSRSHSRGKQHHKSRSRYRRSSSYNKRSPRWSPQRSRRQEDWDPVEKQRQVEERRVVYVGRIEDGTTKLQLRERFTVFGPIVDITLHFRERGDNYGFVTFLYKVDAYEAVEHGNDNPLEPRYDICFGGRRAFCKQRYSDLDRANSSYGGAYQKNSRSNESFDALLREAQENLRKRSFV